MSEARLTALVDAHSSGCDRLAVRVEASLQHQLASFDDWYDDQSVTALASQLVTVVAAGQTQTAALTDAYLATAAGEMLGRAVRPSGVIRDVALRGVTPTVVYTRPAEQYRYQVSTGAKPSTAQAAAVLRASVLARMDLALALRAQVQQFVSSRAVDGYRRVVRPELARDGICTLCIRDADRRYDRTELMALHERCNCTVLPIVRGQDPGLTMNAAEIRAMPADVSTHQVTIHEHGELGPILRPAHQHFRGPTEVAA